MIDPRHTKLANLLVNYSVELQPGEWTMIQANVAALPLAREVYRAALEAGANPSLMLNDETANEIGYRYANDEQLTFVSPVETVAFEQMDALISLRATTNTRAMTNVDPARVARRQASRNPLMKTYMERAASGALKWTLTQFPTQASAQEANLSLEEYEAFVYGATFCDRDDPVAAWRELGALLQGKVDWLKGKRDVVCQGPNIDLRLSIAERTFLADDGHVNMPGGEVYTGPVEESVEG